MDLRFIVPRLQPACILKLCLMSHSGVLSMRELEPLHGDRFSGLMLVYDDFDGVSSWKSLFAVLMAVL